MVLFISKCYYIFSFFDFSGESSKWKPEDPQGCSYDGKLPPYFCNTVSFENLMSRSWKKRSQTKIHRSPSVLCHLLFRTTSWKAKCKYIFIQWIFLILNLYIIYLDMNNTNIHTNLLMYWCKRIRKEGLSYQRFQCAKTLLGALYLILILAKNDLG